MIFLMVGTATGFMMIDDKDGKIFELMQITPLGRKGYLFNRLLLPVAITFIYSLAGWLLLDMNLLKFNLSQLRHHFQPLADDKHSCLLDFVNHAHFEIL